MDTYFFFCPTSNSTYFIGNIVFIVSFLTSNKQKTILVPNNKLITMYNQLSRNSERKKRTEFQSEFINVSYTCRGKFQLARKTFRIVALRRPLGQARRSESLQGTAGRISSFWRAQVTHSNTAVWSVLCGLCRFTARQLHTRFPPLRANIPTLSFRVVLNWKN